MYDLILNRGFVKLSMTAGEAATYGGLTGALGTGAYVASDFGNRYRGSANANAADRIMRETLGRKGRPVSKTWGGAATGYTVTGDRVGTKKMIMKHQSRLPQDLRARTNVKTWQDPSVAREHMLGTDFKNKYNRLGRSSMGKSVRFGDKARSLVKNIGRGGKIMGLGTLGTAAAAALYANYHNRS
tara:strand:- start:24 stop:578 length:555 start_codon:yes stop_codon:yes gene_type:complete